MLKIFRPRGPGRLPTFLIIGAAKCATTSLHYYLDLHPDISMSWEKEVMFFSGLRNWDRGVEWYKRHFVGGTKACGEASVGYTHYPTYTGVPERIHSVIPDAKLIYVVRDPIERIVSDYLHAYADRREERTLDDVLEDLDDNPYAPRSKYAMQIRQYHDYFPKPSLLVITREELLARRPQTLSDVFRFLDVDDLFRSKKFFHVKHRTADKGRKGKIAVLLKRLSETAPAKVFSADFRRQVGKRVYPFFSTRMDRPVVSDQLRAKLTDYLEDDVNQLREFCGRDFPEWSV